MYCPTNQKRGEQKLKYERQLPILCRTSWPEEQLTTKEATLWFGWHRAKMRGIWHLPELGHEMPGLECNCNVRG